MAATTRIQSKGQVTIPTNVRAQAGLTKGDLVEFSYRRGKIVITPKIAIDRSKFPNADDEYTVQQREFIDARLARGLEDVKKGRTVGPFNTAEEMIDHMKAALKKRAVAKKPRP